MSVVKTNLLVKEFMKQRKEVSQKQYFQIQCDLLCEPIAEHFEEFNAIQLHQYFLESGLFYPNAKISNEIKQLEKKQVWDQLQKHYEKLKSTWAGADAHTYLFPIERRNKMMMQELHGKTGVSFHHVIVLFLAKELSIKEIFALFTHEYNHVCRLSYIEKEFEELTLLDSLIIEGMAEVAVEQIFGQEMLAPWVKLYTKQELLPYWSRVHRYLEVKGKENHHLFLYGDKSGQRFPKWFGYSIGYFIVKEYLANNQQILMKDLIKTETAQIFEKSGFA